MKFCLKNALIAVGSYWLSTWAIVPIGALFNGVTDRIAYRDGILSAILMGVMLSMGRAAAAAGAGVCVTLVAEGKNSELWAIIPAVLYPTRMFGHFSHPPISTWYRVMMNVDRFFPAVACILAAFLVTRLRHGRKRQSGAAGG